MTREPIRADTEGLFDILRFNRPAYGEADDRLIERLLVPLGCTPDTAGNYHFTIGELPIIWSCHTDTCGDDGKQASRLGLSKGVIRLHKPATTRSVLGADDGVGVWLMVEMIRNQIPGHYIFHRGEEIGGVGSGHLVKNEPHLLNGAVAAIALDRCDFDNVITHQGFGRCCSLEFATELGKRLGEYKPDDTGVWTDTANYVDHIPECTNLSIGYDGNHTGRETQSLEHVLYLREMLLRTDFSGLPIVRVPGQDDPYDFGGLAGRRTVHAVNQDRYTSDYDDMRDFIKRYPDTVASLLVRQGYTLTDLDNAAWDEIEDPNKPWDEYPDSYKDDMEEDDDSEGLDDYFSNRLTRGM